MGFFDLVLDNIIDMTVVLANGTIAQVSSTSNSDLYWGMKGAGHNFGIVTEANFKIYDFPSPRWFYAELTFADPQLETLFQHINTMNQTKELGSVYTVFAINPQRSATDVSCSGSTGFAKEFLRLIVVNSPSCSCNLVMLVPQRKLGHRLITSMICILLP